MKHILLLCAFFIATVLYAETSRHDKFRGDQLNIGNIQIIGNELSSTSGSVTITPATSLVIRDGSEGTIGHVWTSSDTNGTGGWIAVSGGANTTLSNLTSPTAINEDLIMAGTNTVRLANDTYLLSRNGADSANINVIKVDAFNRTTITSGAAILIDADILPISNNTKSNGVAAVAWADVNSNIFTLANAAEFGAIDGSTTTPSGAVNTLSLHSTTGKAAGAFSSSGTTSAEAYLESGNASDGNSGPVRLQTGTASGTRGPIQFLDGTEGTSGHVWTSTDTSGSGSWQAAAGGAAATNPYQIENLGLDASVSASALTIDLKQSDGSTDPASDSGAVKIAFRDATEANGGYLLRSETAAETIVIPDTATLGFASGVNPEGSIIYIYAIDNAATIELAVSGVNTWLEDRVQTTVAIGTGSDERDVLYSTTLRSNVAVRLIGKAYAEQVVTGEWDVVPTRLTPTNSFLDRPKLFLKYSSNAGQSFTNNVVTRVDYEDLDSSTHPNSITTGSSWIFEPPIPGTYRITTINRFTGLTISDSITYFNAVNGTDVAIKNKGVSQSAESIQLTQTLNLTTSDDFEPELRQSTGLTESLISSSVANIIYIELIHPL